MGNNLNFVNSNQGITNIVSEKELRSIMISTFKELAEVLSQHCGPFSGSAILTNPSNPMAEPVFTKDGINIVSSIRYASALQDFVRMQLAYMGSRIERGAGDGTTSGMMLMAYMLAYLIVHLDKTNDRFTMNDLTTVWNTLISRIETKYKQIVLPVLEHIKGKYDIAYIAGSQAYTSSHGDKELAECISKLFMYTPKEVWDTLMVQKAAYESEQKYKVTIKDSQYTLDNVILFPNKRNKDLGTVLELENANCLIRSFLTMGDDNQKFIHDYIEQCVKDGTQLLVITCNDMDTVTRNHYSELFSENPDHKVMFVLTPFADGNLNDITSLDVIRSQKTGPLDMTQLNLLTASVCCEGDSFRFISGLFDDDGTGINPYYKNKNYPTFNKFVEQIETILTREKSDITSKNAKAIERFTRILYKLKATKDVTFTVGGAAYDNAAGQDIAMDALLATKCSLTQGFTVGRFGFLASAAHDLCATEPNVNKYNRLFKIYCNALQDGVASLNKAMLKYLPSVKSLKDFLYSPVDFTKIDDPSYRPPKTIQDALNKKQEYCILQPAMTDITFIKRFGEVGLKFLKANQIIAAGYFNAEK